MIRFQTQHLQQTLTLHVRAILTGQGWMGQDPPFGAAPVQLRVGRMEEREMASVQAEQANVVAMSFGEEPEVQEVQLGGGLMLQEGAFALDVLPADESIGLAIASDLRDCLRGHLPGYTRYVGLRDFTTKAEGVPAPGHMIEIVDVTRRRADNAEYSLHWQQVIAGFELVFPVEDS